MARTRYRVAGWYSMPNHPHVTVSARAVEAFSAEEARAVVHRGIAQGGWVHDRDIHLETEEVTS